MSTEPKRGTKGETMSKRERFGTCDMLNIPHPQGHAGCANWREGENAPAQPCKKCGKPKFGPWSTICSADIGKVNEYYCQCVEVFEAVPPAAETAMTAEQLMIDGIARNLYQREQYLKTGRISADLFTESVGSTQSTYRRWARFLLGETVIDSPEPLAAHVREAAQREIEDLNRTLDTVVALRDATEKSWAKQLKRTETTERKLAEVEKVLQATVTMLKVFTSGAVAGQEFLIQVASLRAEAQKGLMKDNEVELPPTFGQTGSSGDVEGMLAVAGLRHELVTAQRERLNERAEWEKLLAAAHAARDAFESDLEATERKLAEVEKVLQEAVGLDFVSSGDHSQPCVCWRCRAEAAWPSLRAESKEG